MSSINIWRDPSSKRVEPGERNVARCYQGGAIVFSGGGKSGRKRKKPAKREQFSGLYANV